MQIRVFIGLALGGLTAVMAAGADLPALEIQARPRPRVAETLTNAAPTNTVGGRRVYTWQDVEMDGYRAYLNRLRDAGCPEPAVQQIVRNDINDLFTQKRMQLAIAHDHEWWRFEADPTLTWTFEEKRQAMAEEKTVLMKKLLEASFKETDEEAASPNTVVALTGPVLGRLPRQTHDVVQEVCARSMERSQTLFMERQNDNQPVGPADLARLRNQTRTDLAQIMTPAELEEFLIRFSHNSVKLRNELRGFEPNAEEFRQIFRATDKLEHQMQLEFGGLEMLSAKQREQFERQRERAVRSVLTADRFEAYLLQKDPVFRQTQFIAQQVGAPVTVIVPLYRLKKEIETQRQQIARDNALTSEQKTEALRSAQTNQQVALKKILGADAYQRYVQFGFHLN